MKHNLGILDFSGTHDPHILFPNGSRVNVRESNYKGFVNLKFKKHTVPIGSYRELYVNLCDQHRGLNVLNTNHCQNFNANQKSCSNSSSDTNVHNENQLPTNANSKSCS